MSRVGSRDRSTTRKYRSPSQPWLPMAAISSPISCTCPASLPPRRRDWCRKPRHQRLQQQTKTALESFWAYIAFIMNSLVFLLIGLEVHVDALVRSWRPVLLCVVAVLVGRALSVYLLVPLSNTLAEKIPLRWQHMIVWGGLRGSLALALALSLDSRFPERSRVLDLTFGVVVFSILVQGLTIKPLLKILGLSNGPVSTETSLQKEERPVPTI